MANAFDGSNPSPTTRLRQSATAGQATLRNNVIFMEIAHAIIEAKETPAAYVLANKERNYLYKGAARNLRERLKDHMAGRASRTKNRRPLFLVYMEYCDTYSEALARERYFKSGPGRAWLKHRIQPGQTVPPIADPLEARSALSGPASGRKSVG